MSDRRTPDGSIAESERIIRRGGRIKYAHRWWQHDELKQYEGMEVTVCSDCWFTELDVFGLPSEGRTFQRVITIKALTPTPEGKE